MPSRLIDSLATTEALTALFDDDSLIQAMLDFEAALARAEARRGVIPQSAADAISKVCGSVRLDAALLARASRQQATIAIPFVKALREAVREASSESAPFVHWGATSQDVTDTAMVLLLQRAHGILAADHRRLSHALRRLSDAHADSVMLGRTLLQPAPPTTFGLKVAGWFASLDRGRTRLEVAFEEANVLQFGGASGTLAALADRGTDVMRALGEELTLAVPAAPWHSHRDRIAAIVTSCGIYTGSLGKMARDASLLMQQEVGEVAETGGGSSTMPHKRNPSSFTIALACANRVPGLVANFLAGMAQEHERAAGGLQAEWPSVAGVVEATGAALASVANAMDGLQVFPERMRANIDATKGLVFSERVSMLIAGATGRDRAHQLLADASQKAVNEDVSLAEAIRRTPDLSELITPEQIASLDVPEDYLGAAELFRQQLLNVQES